MWECLCWANQELLFWEFVLQWRERPVRPNSFPRRDLSHTEVTISVSHGAFLRIKGRRDEKMKEENTKRRPALPGDLFSHTHLCWEGIIWPHTCVPVCLSSWRRCSWVWERVCVWGTVHYGMWPRPPSEDWGILISELLMSWSVPSIRYEQQASVPVCMLVCVCVLGHFQYGNNP